MLVRATIIFLLVFGAYTSFLPQSPYNPQHITRVALAQALTEGGVSIDRVEPYTVDKAYFDGHYYADKPPGLSLLAVPSALLTGSVLNNAGIPPDISQSNALIAYEILATASTVSLLAALAVAAVYLLALRLGAGEGAALFSSCALALGTPFFGWSTMFFAHAASGSVLLLAFALAVWMRGRSAGWIGFVLGLVLGFALVIDLPAAPAAALVGLYHVLQSREGAWRRLLLGAAGGLIGLAPLFIYNWIAFQSPFRLGYAEVVGFAGMKEGLFGLSLPNPMVLWEVLFGLYRGLLPLSPVLLLVPIGVWAMWRRPDLRAEALVVAGTIACFLLINSSYHYWDGGGSTGPRHLVAMLPLTAIALAFAWPKAWTAQLGAFALLAASLFLSVVCASVLMSVSSRYANPLFDLLLPRFFSADAAKAAPTVLVWAGFAVLATLRTSPQASLVALLNKGLASFAPARRRELSGG